VLKLFNTLTGRKEVVRPIQNKTFRYYSCGPTVYDFVHIGNLRSFWLADLLKKYLRFKGFKVIHVMNITDVDDKLIRKANGSRERLTEITKMYEDYFIECLRKLNIELPEYLPRATEHIPEMVNLIQRLLDKGVAYLGSDSTIYYDISKFPEYGKLSKLKLESLKAGARVSSDEYGKNEASDFALWKAWKPEDGEIFWEPEFIINGKRIKIKGRPGWHIECSSMSMKYLGEGFEIHSGGVDLIFPHHENEIAQSEAATGKQFVRYWVHHEFLLVNGNKMSKSLGNIITLRDVEEKGISPLALRYFYFTSHYKDLLNFTWEALQAAEVGLARIQNFYENLLLELERSKAKKLNEEDLKFRREINTIYREIIKAMDDDLNTPVALSKLHQLIERGNIYLKGNPNKYVVKELFNKLLALDAFFGLLRKDIKVKYVKFEDLERKESNMEEILELLGKFEKIREEKVLLKLLGIRQFFREKGEWDKADFIRSELRKLNVFVNDLKDGFFVIWH